MIIANKGRYSQKVFIPRSGEGVTENESVVFEVVNTITRETIFSNEVELMNDSTRYYTFLVTFGQGLDVGEYEYKLSNTEGGKILSTGIIRLCEDTESAEYEQEIKYKQYERK